MKTTYTHNLKEYTLDEIYNNYSYWDYLEIQFNRLGKWKLYNKSWWEAIKFDWIDEFYCSDNYWDYIRIQFNILDKWKLYNKSWWEAIKFNWIDEFYDSDSYWDYIKIQFNKWEDFKKFYYKDINKKITIELTQEQLDKIKDLI